MPQKFKTGVISTSDIYESDGMNTYTYANTPISFTPNTGTNSCSGQYTWYTPDGAVTGDVFRIFVTIDYNGFDTSNTAGTFDMWWQGSVYDNTTETWKWEGNCNIAYTLNNVRPKTVVLSSTKGTYTWEQTMALSENNATRYVGQHLQLRSDYSNGTGTLTIRDFKVILDKYSVSTTPPIIREREGDDYIAVEEFMEL